MMAAARSLIVRFRQAGATLTCGEHGEVRFAAPTPLPASLLDEARQHRDAIAAVLASEPSERLPDPPSPESKRGYSLNREIMDGYHRAALRRPPSWWRAEAHRPTPGAT